MRRERREGGALVARKKARNYFKTQRARKKAGRGKNSPEELRGRESENRCRRARVAELFFHRYTFEYSGWMPAGQSSRRSPGKELINRN